jgi:hypothetical protein
MSRCTIMTRHRQLAGFALGLSVVLLADCSNLLPRGESVAESPWHSYAEAQRTFDKIIPCNTTAQDLKALKLGPDA